MKKIVLASAADWLAWADERSVPEPNTGCHLWLGATTDTGRPHVSVGGISGNGFRLLWQGVRGAIPPGIYLCHHCDNQLCINLDHGFLGTPRDNAQDCARKGRQWLQRVPAHKNPNTKLSADDAAYLARVYVPYSQSFGARALARAFGVQRETVRAAISKASQQTERV